VTASRRSGAWECRLPHRGAASQRRLMGALESKLAAGIAPSPGSAYWLPITGNYQRASVAERPVVLPPEQRKGSHGWGSSRCYRGKSFSAGVPRTAGSAPI
jgi:hypothetical protein